MLAWFRTLEYFKIFASLICNVLSLYAYLCVYTYTGWYVMADSFYDDRLLYVYMFWFPGAVVGMILYMFGHVRVCVCINVFANRFVRLD